MEPGLHHAAPRAAELEAAEKVAPHLKKMKLAIYTAAVLRGTHGVTPDEYANQTGAIINTVRRRFTDLWKEGHLRPTDRTRPNARGNAETVWVAGRDELGMAPAAAKATTQAAMRSRILLLESQSCPHLIHLASEEASKKIERLEQLVRMLTVEGQRLQGRLWHHAEHPYTHKYADTCACESCAASRSFDNLVVEAA